MDIRKSGWEVEVLYVGSQNTVAKRWGATKQACEFIYLKSKQNPETVIECNTYHNGKRVHHWNRRAKDA